MEEYKDKLILSIKTDPDQTAEKSQNIKDGKDTKDLNMAGNELLNFRNHELIPFLDDSQENRLNLFCRQLQSIKSLGIFAEGKSLMFVTLIKNNKIDIYNNLSDDQKETLEEFLKYMKTNYGLSEVSKRMY